MHELPEGYTLSCAGLEDIPALISLDRAASKLFEPTGLLGPEALDSHVPADILEQEIPLSNVIVCRNQQGWPVGFALARPRADGLYLDQISVHPDHGRQGLGRALVLEVLEEARRRRMPHVTLSTFRDLPWNGPFYHRMGFRELSRRKYSPYMIEIETAQRDIMDVSKRCFMRYKIKRLRRAGQKKEKSS